MVMKLANLMRAKIHRRIMHSPSYGLSTGCAIQHVGVSPLTKTHKSGVFDAHGKSVAERRRGTMAAGEMTMPGLDKKPPKVAERAQMASRAGLVLERFFTRPGVDPF